MGIWGGGGERERVGVIYEKGEVGEVIRWGR